MASYARSLRFWRLALWGERWNCAPAYDYYDL